MAAEGLKIVRRYVPNDHECLFTAIAYLVEGSRHGAAGQRLRKICSDRIASDPEMFNEATLGMPNPQYVEWIKNPFNWGGDIELGILAAHFDVEIAVVVMEAVTVLDYSLGQKNRVYLLYTGQHYDPLVAAKDEDSLEEVRLFTVGDKSMDASALDCARMHAKIAAEKASQRTVTRLKCSGCGAILKDTDEFQAHCGDVEHDDDFSYMCDEVQIVERGDDEVPEDRIDLTSPDVYTFYNTPTHPFSLLHASPFTVNGKEYRSAEHFFRSAQFDGVWGEKIREAATVNQIAMLMMEADGNEKSDWEQVKDSVLEQATRAKFANNESLKSELLATESKTIVMIDGNQWMGMSAAGGIPTGRNKIGEILMAVRSELQKCS